MTETNRPIVAATPGPITQLKLTEPARLYGYGLQLVGLIGLIVYAAMTGEWATLLPVLIGVAGIGAASTEAIRKTAWSPAFGIAAVRQAAGYEAPASARYSEALSRFQAMANDGVKPGDQ